jgi:hypothetical protein
MSPNESLVLGYLVGSIATYVLGRSYWVKQGINVTLDAMMKSNFVKWRKVNGEIEFLKVDQDPDKRG